MDGDTPYNPWQALRARPWLTLIWVDAEQPGGIIYDRDGRGRILLSSRLGRVARNETLTHELVHDDRRILHGPDTPAAIMVREEETVRRETARRLVPLGVLAGFVERRVTVQAITAAVVADEFDVSVDVARRALETLRAA